MTEEEPKITAWELRKMGYSIPESIPDCAWIPWHAIDVDVDSVNVDKNGTFSFKCQFTRPFKWIEHEVVITKD